MDNLLLEKITNGRSQGSWNIDNIVIDSRKINSKSLFVALKGANQDGHNYVNDVLDNAAAAMVSNDGFEGNILKVDNCLDAINDIAKYKREKIDAKYIAITGSVGKTSVKEMLYRVLSYTDSSYANKGNLNNHIGMPLTLANITDDIKYCILEMGMNHIGEIESLSNIARPDIAIITSIDPSHIGNFKDLAEIAKAKSEIFSALNGVAILNKDNEFFDYLSELAKPNKIISFGTNSDIEILDIEFNKGYDVKISSYGKKYNYRLNCLGRHNVQNSLIIFAVLEALGLEVEKYLKAFENYKVPKGRGNIISKSNITIIDDSYNASPRSMEASIDMLSLVEGKKIVLLGDMLELGEKSEYYHRKIINKVLENNIDSIYLVGNCFKDFFDAIPNEKKGKFYKNSDEAVDILNYLNKGDTLLVKGSNSIKLSSVVDSLEKKL